MADRTGDHSLLFEAANLGEVECRLDMPIGISPMASIRQALNPRKVQIMKTIDIDAEVAACLEAQFPGKTPNDAIRELLNREPEAAMPDSGEPRKTTDAS